MAQLRLILQAATGETHAGAIGNLLGGFDPDSVLISVGFVREAGIEALETALKPVAPRTRFFVGIRNDITTMQAIKRILKLSAEVYAVDELFQSGRLADETVIPAPTLTSGIRKGTPDSLPRMKLNRTIRPRIGIGARKATTKKLASPGMPEPIPAVRATEYYRVWVSNDLRERDLSVPTGATTNPTGSMLWKKGAMERIDQRHFFRDAIFNALIWRSDPQKPHLERAEAVFELVIKNLNYGPFRLRLTHNTKTNTRTYRQRNAMTQIHWGDAQPFVARRDLLGRTMYLYRKDTDPPEFLVEID